MHQAVDKQIVETHEETEAGHAGNNAAEHFTDVILHKVAFQPVGNVARRFIGATFSHRTVLAQLQHFFEFAVPTTGRRPALFRFAVLFGQLVLDRTVHRQIRITADR
ncbi:hypothetical protein D3C79_607900 [compost metagenome]